jgi:type IV pilus assembly protein PilC
MTTSLQTISKSITNLELKKDIQQMIYFIKKGDKLTRSLHQSRVFPYMVVQMITVGEETAELPEMLLKISDHYDKELDNTLEMLSSVVEPLIIILLGLIIGLILVSIYLPLFNISGFIPGQ